MASILKTIEIDAPADEVWDAVSDFGAVHTRFAPGFVTDVTLEPGARIVTFANGAVAREMFLGSDTETRRLAYSIRGERFEHHSASFTVVELDDDRCRLDWAADLLPDAAAPMVAAMMEQGIAVAGRTLSRATS